MDVSEKVSPVSLSNEATARAWLSVVPDHPSREEDESSELSVGSSYALIVPVLPVRQNHGDTPTKTIV